MHEEWTQETTDKQTVNLNQLTIDYMEENDVQCCFSKDFEEESYRELLTLEMLETVVS